LLGNLPRICDECLKRPSLVKKFEFLFICHDRLASCLSVCMYNLLAPNLLYVHRALNSTSFLCSLYGCTFLSRLHARHVNSFIGLRDRQIVVVRRLQRRWCILTSECQTDYTSNTPVILEVRSLQCGFAAARPGVLTCIGPAACREISDKSMQSVRTSYTDGRYGHSKVDRRRVGARGVCFVCDVRLTFVTTGGIS